MHPIRRFNDGDLVTPEDQLWNPQTLYHYTTREGLVGILSSGTAWATSIRFLNDASEYTYAQSRFVEMLREIQGQVPPLHEEELEETIRQLSGLTPHLFVFCLSRKGDLLSQWRAYGQPGNGYSIGFDAPAVDGIIRQRRGMQLAAVSYDPRQQRDLLNRVGNEAFRRSRSGSDDPRAFRKALCDIFLDVAPIIKDSAFTEEDEWRLVLRLDGAGSPQIKVRAGRSTLVLYVPIKLGTKDRPLPIREIVIGPNPHRDLNEEAIKAFCRQCDIEAAVKNSAIPYRSM